VRRNEIERHRRRERPGRTLDGPHHAQVRAPARLPAAANPIPTPAAAAGNGANAINASTNSFLYIVASIATVASAGSESPTGRSDCLPRPHGLLAAASSPRIRPFANREDPVWAGGMGQAGSVGRRIVRLPCSRAPLGQWFCLRASRSSRGWRGAVSPWWVPRAALGQLNSLVRSAASRTTSIPSCCFR